uniref:NADH dehydrogenase subunit 4L n=1 Tax=Eurytemora affinis TaxID=88015 RepID=A0A6G7NYM3_EURAF|nr:NADH dehydrogenase subunit 4L [Eurytemora affinis]QIJ60009.1 NADH dehydrogenase subunit 4L [Eurytemora affinis]
MFSGLSFNSLLVLVLTLQLVFYSIALVKVWFHVIMLMMVLEFLSISLFFCGAVLVVKSISPLLIFFLATLMVCEASMGLGLVVGLTRGRSNEAVII